VFFLIIKAAHDHAGLLPMYVHLSTLLASKIIEMPILIYVEVSCSSATTSAKTRAIFPFIL
jgi:hypothetical protein